MGDVGFSELIVVTIVALLVIGPKRLPEVARTMGRWVGKARAFVNSVKNDIDRELRAQELQEMIKLNERNDSVYSFLEDTKSNSESSAHTARKGDWQAPS